jgi:hypothetical protein
MSLCKVTSPLVMSLCNVASPLVMSMQCCISTSYVSVQCCISTGYVFAMLHLHWLCLCNIASPPWATPIDSEWIWRSLWWAKSRL